MNANIQGGLTGTLLRVNLTNGAIRKVATPRELYERYIGARGVGAAMLLDELAPHTDPWSPDNKLIFLTGPLEGTLAPGANKLTVTFRSPLSGTYSFSACGGHLAPEVKFAGYDGIIIEGASEKPVYLAIENDRVRIKDAAHLWGKLTHDTEDAIRAELHDPDARVAVIGPAGEKRVRFACIQSDYHREFGRGGAGAVMGAKNLKAIAVRGSGYVTTADPQALRSIAESTYRELKDHPKAQARRQYGTPEMVEGTNNLGFWATRNFTTGYFEGAKPLSAANLAEQLYMGDSSCYGCTVACGKLSAVTQGPFAGAAIEGAEFETIGLLGANCGVSDPHAVAAATAICDSYGFDTMSAGLVASMAMEAYQRGAIQAEETGGLALNFGSGQALIALMEWIGKREGLGDLLAEGAQRAADRLGVPELAMTSKCQELATYEPRGVVGMGLSYAVSPKGGHHMIAPTMGLEVAGDPANRLKAEGKPRMVADTQFIMAVVDSLTLCSSMRFVLGPQAMLELYRSVTGMSLSVEEANRIGERILNLERLFNVREGFRREHDSLPKRLVMEPMPTGPSAGNRVPLEEMLDAYYELMGWDDQGIPTCERMQSLGLEAEWQAALGGEELSPEN